MKLNMEEKALIEIHTPLWLCFFFALSQPFLYKNKMKMKEEKKNRFVNVNEVLDIILTSKNSHLSALEYLSYYNKYVKYV